MILSPLNSTYPPFWGKEIKQTNTGWEIKDSSLDIQMPYAFDFFMQFCSKDPQNAKTYYKI